MYIFSKGGKPCVEESLLFSTKNLVVSIPLLLLLGFIIGSQIDVYLPHPTIMLATMTLMFAGLALAGVISSIYFFKTTLNKLKCFFGRFPNNFPQEK